MTGKQPTWRSPKFYIALLSVIAVLTMAIVDLRRSSPGPVAGSHARVPKLHGGQSCAQCHGGLFSDMTSSCLECHGPIQQQLDAGRGLHGQLGKQRASQCALCHSEHHGEDFVLVNEVSFAQAGAGDPESFDHTTIGFAMAGPHLAAACEDCHVLAHAPALRAGQRRFLGLTQRCDSCHHDAHRGRMQLDCASCHSQDHFHDLVPRDHDRVLPLEGGHAPLACTACHKPDDPRHSLDALGAKVEHTTRTCADCHESPHGQAFLAGNQATQATPQLGACAVCHEPAHESFAAAAQTLTAEQHAHSGYRLDLPHQQATCAQCHSHPTQLWRDRFPGRGQDHCRACHEDPHAGQFDFSALAVAGCVDCHARTHFSPHEFTLDKHARTALPLVGRHEQTACDKCHVQPSLTVPRLFHGTDTQCGTCHADAHDGAFAAKAAARPTPAHGECAHCHQSTTFKDLATPFTHGPWTGFSLRDAHEQAECQACHPATPVDPRGRSFARALDVFPDLRHGAHDCRRCHQDPHQGQFDGKGLPARVDGRDGCARCHAESSFRALPHGFDHARWTGHALTGAHEQLECAQCHAPLPQADPHGRTWSRAAGTRCADCHQDRHAGQFAIDGKTDCARCHQPHTFKAIKFNHNLDARFRLGEAHAKLACASCHKATEIGGQQVVRYKPIAHACFDCHGMHEDQLRRSKKRGS